MGKPTRDVVLLFSYGTLRDGAVQMASFGRLLTGRADALPGYAIVPLAIRDPAVVALSGKSQHMIARRSNAGDEVSGVVFENHGRGTRLCGSIRGGRLHACSGDA